LRAGVKVNVPFEATVGPAANMLGLLFDTTWNERDCPASFAGPTDIPVAQPGTDCGPESSSTVWFAPLAKLGASFTGITRIVNVWSALVSWPPLAVPPLSNSRTVTVAEPKAFAAGVYVSVPVGLMAGNTLKSALLLVETWNV